MKVIIAGDSYGAGVLEPDGRISHLGLEQFLKDDGHSVINLSQGGISNLDIWKRLAVYFERFPDVTADLVLVFQSEWHRDFKHAGSWPEVFSHDDWNQFQSIEDLQSRWISRFYQFLSDISTQQQIPIYIIGGAGDTLWLDNMSEHYPGCRIACQSLTNLLLQGDHRIAVPVLGYYGNKKESDPLIQHIKSLIKSDYLQGFIDDMTRAYMRVMIQNENPEFFWPDGNHPNIKAHKILRDFLIQQGIIK